MIQDPLIQYASGQGWISPKQAQHVADALELAERTGRRADAAHTLISFGYLTSQQVEQAREAMQRGEGKLQIPGVELMEEIGSGGFGAVYKARQKDMDRLVAVKVLSKEWSGNEEYVQRFLREVRAAAKMNHDNLVNAINAGQSGGRYYLVMEYVKGRPLADLIEQSGPMPAPKALSIVRQMAAALQHAHGMGLVHRDVKPANVLVTPDGQAKLCDLGLAWSRDKQSSGARRLTQDGQAMGTPQYMSPEQARGEADLDGRSDIYSLGLVFYEMLAGKPAFEAENAMGILARQLNDPLPDITAQRSDVPRGALAIMEKMTRKDRDRRYEHAEALIADLAALAEGRPLSAGTGLRPRTRSSAHLKRPSDRLPRSSARLKRASDRLSRTSTRLRTQSAPGKRVPVWPWIVVAIALIGAVLLVLLAFTSGRPEKKPPPREGPPTAAP